MTMFLSWSVVIDEIMEDLAGFFARVAEKAKMAQLSAGLVANGVTNFLFDYVLYTGVIFFCQVYIGGIGGTVVGGFVMTVLSAQLCHSLIGPYDRYKKDWLAIEAIKEAASESRVVSWIFRRTSILFVVLCIKFDPLITTLVLRKGSFNGLTERDKKIFWASVIFSNAYWTLVVITGISLAINPNLLNSCKEIVFAAFLFYYCYVTRKA